MVDKHKKYNELLRFIGANEQNKCSDEEDHEEE